MNLQICFMNETASDTESPSSDSESCPKLSKINTRSKTNPNANPYSSRPLTTSKKVGQGSYGVNSKGGCVAGIHYFDNIYVKAENS
jgi:hypothetical protein